MCVGLGVLVFWNKNVQVTLLDCATSFCIRKLVGYMLPQHLLQDKKQLWVMSRSEFEVGQMVTNPSKCGQVEKCWCVDNYSLYKLSL